MAARRSRGARAGLILILGLLATLPLVAEGSGLEASASGWVTPSVYVRPQASDPLAAAGVRGGFTLDGWAGDAVGFRAALEAYTNFAGVADGGSWEFDIPYPLAFSASANDRLKAVLDLKEAWFDFSAGDFDVRIGKQVVAWGLADGSNPTDNVNARYVGTRFVSTLDEQKMGALMANVVYNLPGNLGTAQGLLLPVSTPHDMPSIAQTISAGPMTIVIEEDEAPEVAFRNVEGGLRALVYAGNLSLSASWLTYLNRYFDFDVSEGMPTTYTPVHSRIHQFGLDAAWLAGGFDLRTEWALSLTADPDGADPAVLNPYLSGVAQASRSFLNGNLTATLSWAPQFVFNHQEATPGGMDMASMMAEYNGQAYALEQIVGVRLSGKLLAETLQPEALFLTGLAARDWMGAASVSYNLADGVNAKAGLKAYGSFRALGDKEREWGTFSNSRVIDTDCLYLEVRISL